MPNLRSTEHGKVYSRPNSRILWVRFKGPDGREIRRSSGVTEVEAAVEFLVREHQRGRELTFKAAVVDFFEVHSRRLKPTTLKGYKSTLRRINPVFGNKLVSEIDRTMLKSFTAARRRKVSAATVRRELAFISTVISHAIEAMEGAPEVNQVTLFSKRSLKEFPRTRWITEGEFTKLEDCCTNPMQKSILKTAVFTGMRSAELKALRKSMIDFDREQIVLPGRLTKNHKPRVIPLSPDALRTLKEVCKTAPDDLVFWHWNSLLTKRIPYGDFRRFFEGARNRSGLEDLKFHDLRHTFASWWVQKGGDLYALMKILGHSSLQMVQRYAHLDSSGTHRAMREVFPHTSGTTESDGSHSTT